VDALFDETSIGVFSSRRDLTTVASSMASHGSLRRAPNEEVSLPQLLVLSGLCSQDGRTSCFTRVLWLLTVVSAARFVATTLLLPCMVLVHFS
jgi:hypothetical protein